MANGWFRTAHIELENKGVDKVSYYEISEGTFWYGVPLSSATPYVHWRSRYFSRYDHYAASDLRMGYERAYVGVMWR